MPEENENLNQNNGGGGGGEPDAAIQAQISKAIEDATAGLKRTNAELKNEKTTLKEQFDGINSVIEALGGIDAIKGLGNAETIKQMAEMQKRFAADEQGKLLSEGKYDEWFDRRTASLRKDHENQTLQLQKQLEEANGLVNSTQSELRAKVLETEVSTAIVDAGVVPEAKIDVQLRAERAFTYDPERKRFVMKDEDGGVVFGKDGSTPKTLREWIDDQKEVARHWFPPSQGGGLNGSRGPAGKTSLEKLDMRAYSEQRKKDGFKTF